MISKLYYTFLLLFSINELFLHQLSLYDLDRYLLMAPHDFYKTLLQMLLQALGRTRKYAILSLYHVTLRTRPLSTSPV